MARRFREPGLWAMFSGGGMMAALFWPVIAAVLWVAAPLGWIEVADLAGLVLHPVSRVVLFFLITLSFFHWAHRFRYTLYDGLQLYHLNQLVAILTYGIATALSGVTLYVLWTVA